MIEENKQAPQFKLKNQDQNNETVEKINQGSICMPNTGICKNHMRMIPVTLVDVAGLVPGAHEGRGRGNQFLSDLSRCDALIQVIDVLNLIKQ